MTEERRRTSRYPFVASAEVIEESSGAKVASRVSELGLNGCYLDMTNPLPAGTTVTVKIFTAADFFEAPGKVIYVQPNLGMGVEFHGVKVFFQGVLKKWLLMAMTEKAT